MFSSPVATAEFSTFAGIFGNTLQYSCLGNPMDRKAVATGLEKVSFHSNPKKGNAKECSNYSTIALISHASKFSSVRSLSCV